MKEPRIIKTIRKGATYELPTYKITPEGIKDGKGILVKFCKGNMQNGKYFKQDGILAESMIQLLIEFLTEVNQGELATRETAIAITKLDEALMWIQKRTEDRRLRGVEATYQK